MLLRRSVLAIRTRHHSSWVHDYLNRSYEERTGIIQNVIVPYFNAYKPNAHLHDCSIINDLSKTAGGCAAAVQLRADIPKLKKEPRFASIAPTCTEIDSLLQFWLQAVFCVDTLILKQITFDSSASVLENVAREDTVYAVQTITELKKRFHNGRRCFGLFHHFQPNHPIAFIHIGLTSDLAFSRK